MPEQSEPLAFGKSMWLLWSWWRGDALPICSVVSGLTVEESKHVELLSHLMGIPSAALREQLWLGHRAYLARLGTLPTCHVARPTTQPVLVWVCYPPRLARSRNLPTLASSHPADRGAGALLDHSPAREYAFPTRDTQSWLSRSWSLSFLPTGGLGLVPPPGDSERAQVAAHLLGLPLIGETEDT